MEGMEDGKGKDFKVHALTLDEQRTTLGQGLQVIISCPCLWSP